MRPILFKSSALRRSNSSQRTTNRIFLVTHSTNSNESDRSTEPGRKLRRKQRPNTKEGRTRLEPKQVPRAQPMVHRLFGFELCGPCLLASGATRTIRSSRVFPYELRCRRHQYLWLGGEFHHPFFPAHPRFFSRVFRFKAIPPLTFAILFFRRL